jgi:hypothetical protein
MNKETRTQKIAELLDKDAWGHQEIMWEDDLQSLPVYKVRLDYLVYNKYNGRILSRTESIEQQYGKDYIKAETEDGKKYIADLLWESKLDRNKKTKEDIEKNGQKDVGIITRDGIIIDGNRRAMLLNRINDEGKVKNRDYFKAIILPVTLDENRIEIEKLETSYQMGADEKLGYNPIEKYLKVKNLKNKGVSVVEISDWMGESESTVDEYIAVMKTMDDYLDYMSYNGIYTQLDGREDQFINLTKWLDTFYGGGSSKAFDGYTDSDVDDLKLISFDYIRVKYEGKKFRLLGYGLSQNHFFGNKQTWESFRDAHFKNISPLYDLEEKINLDSPKLTTSLNSRDTDFTNKAENLLDDNLSDHQQKIFNQRYKAEPEKLISKSIDAINVAKVNINVENPEVMKKIEELNEITTAIILEKSPMSLLRKVLNLLSLVSIGGHEKDKAELLISVKDVESEAYQLEKKIKQLK